MNKKLTLSILLLLLTAIVSDAQWRNAGGTWAFTDTNPDTLTAMIHGLTVDPDGKIWVQPWATTDVAVAEGDTVKGVYALRVYNADGTEAEISPVFQITTGGGFVTDTLYGSTISNPRGLRADHEGNILAVWGNQFMHRIDYKTGEGLNRIELGLGTSPAAPAVDEQGRIFVAPVVPGNPIQIYNPDFSFVGNAVEETKGFSRTVMVSKDGNTIYHMAYDRSINTVFNKPNVFAGYDSVGTILEGFAIESADWNPKSDLFWASAGSYNDPATGYSNNTWYGYDVANDAIVDSFKWQFTVTNSANERPRGLAFSPDGNTAYVGYFGAGGPPSIQKFEQDLTPVNITFNVDMNIQIDEGLFNSSTGTIALAGSFNEWSTSANPMTDTDGDGIYSATIDALEPGTRVYFKFVKDGQLEENLKESPYENNNRSHVVTGGNTSYTAFYDDYLGSGIEIQFTFRCNMEVEILRGNFNPSGDVLYVKGTFNEFGETNPLTVTSDENIYEAVVPIKAFEGDVFDYYFAFGDMQEETISYTVKSADITTAVSTISRAFNGIRAEDVTEMEVTIVFQLDMRGAVNDVTKSAFDVVENVVLAGKAAPLQWPSAGWPDSDLNLVKQLNDNGEDGDLFAQDSIWGTTVTFPAYTHMFFEYKYGANWGLASNGGSNDNEASTGVLHRMDLSKDVLSAVAFDTWADMSPTNLDSIVSDVREIPASIPVSYVLEQNYPNPFNPTTNIRFAVPQADKVTLKVFDVLGQEVATLLDEFKNAGTYEATFDASRLSSGLYVYVLSTGKYVTSRKMMLLK